MRCYSCDNYIRGGSLIIVSKLPKFKERKDIVTKVAVAPDTFGGSDMFG